jgi:1-aminocyclopropane-1-carboxylate deaminase
MHNEISISNCIIQPVIPQLWDKKKISWDVFRLDLIHPIVSGNKFFKLRFYLGNAIASGRKGILTFGGAYSNHILATAFAGKKAGLSTIGIIRGEEPVEWSPTLLEAQQYGMKVIFTERGKYRELSSQPESTFRAEFPDHLVVPEGGFGKTGMLGAAEIQGMIPENQYDWIICACGTGTMMAGLLQAAQPGHKVLGIPVLKNHREMEADIRQLLGEEKKNTAIQLDHSFHFGGYSKKTDELIIYMNTFYQRTGIPTDFVYTGKLMFAVQALLDKGFFPSGSRILTIHSGGLQGNRSLKKGILDF